MNDAVCKVRPLSNIVQQGWLNLLRSGKACVNGQTISIKPVSCMAVCTRETKSHRTESICACYSQCSGGGLCLQEPGECSHLNGTVSSKRKTPVFFFFTDISLYQNTEYVESKWSSGNKDHYEK